MKKVMLLFMLSSVVMFANATIIVDELFEYNTSNFTKVKSWNHAGDIKSGDGRTLQKKALEYSNTGGTYVHSGEGKTMNSELKTANNTVADAFVSYRTFPNGPISSGNIYLSFLYKADGNQTQPGTDIIGLGTTSAQTTFRAYAARQTDGTTNPFRIGVNNSTSGGATAYSSSVFESDVVYLIVIKYSFVTKQASMFSNPIIAAATEPTPDAITAEKAITSLENLMFYSAGTNAASNFYISGVRVSTTWAEAVAAK